MLDLRVLDLHEGWRLVRHLGRDQDPAVALDLDQPLAEPELAHPVEVGDRLGRQGQALAGGQLGDPLAVRWRSRISARRRRSMSSTAAANSSSSAASSSCTRDSGTPASARVRILHELDDGGRVVSSVAGVVALGLGQQTLGVVVAHGAHRHAGVRRELADGEHGAIVRAWWRRVD